MSRHSNLRHAFLCRSPLPWLPPSNQIHMFPPPQCAPSHCCTMSGELGIDNGVVGYSYSEQFAEWSKECDRGGVYHRGRQTSGFAFGTCILSTVGVSVWEGSMGGWWVGGVAQRTHMRVRMLVRRRVGVHGIHAGQVAIVHVRRDGLLVRVALDGVVEVCHGRERHGHGSCPVLICLGRHGPILMLRGCAVRCQHHVLRWWVCGVGIHGSEHGWRRMRTLTAVVWCWEHDVVLSI